MSKMSFLCYIQNKHLKSGIITAYLTANDEVTLFSFFLVKFFVRGSLRNRKLLEENSHS